jgi:class 3 adenylate cyclase/tetratricopeptide (TPR) repeat protein
MKCPKCEFENREGAKFCGNCRAKLTLVCPRCKSENPPENKFCDECGQDLGEAKEVSPVDYDRPQSYTPKFLADKILTTRSSIEGERKLVTVLFADVANYTSIAEKLDPEEIHQIMDGCFQILMDEIHKYEGTINQFTGDGVMALFGAPVAHEDHAQRACYAALSIQRAMEEYGEKVKKNCGVEFNMRIGLNSGPVIVGSIGDDLRMDYTAVGDTTNLASRMENMARPGTILGAGNIYKLARDFFEFESLGEVQVKGKEGFQEAYELKKATEVETRIEAAAAKGLTKFVGRTREAGALKEAYEHARAGKGHVVGIVGEAGVGKSRLLLEFRNILLEGKHIYLEGRCLHYGGSMPYLPILDILKSYFELKEGDREFLVKKKLEEKIVQLDERLKRLLPPLQEIFSVKVDDRAYLQLGPEQKKMRTFEAIRELLVRQSENKPIVLAIEDLHWIDKTSEDFLSYLIELLASAHILLILLYRPEYTHVWESKSYYSKIGVDQLSATTSTELVQAILWDGEVMPELRELVLSKAGGNPLFVEELTHSLVENGSIQRKDRQYVLTRKASEIEVPGTIQGIIAARIDRVEESLKRIMQVASVIGREFAFRVLQSMMGMREELKSSLLNLQGLEFISEKRLFPELEYIFKHALTQEVAYNSLLQKRRKEIHEKIGRAIEALYPESLQEYYELLAYHYGRSDNKVKALEYLDLANRKAVNVSAMVEAKAYFDEAMGLLDMLPETADNQQRRISLIANQVFVFIFLFKNLEYYELLTRYEPLAVELGNHSLLGPFYGRLGHSEWALGKIDQAIQTLTKSAELCEAAENFEDAALDYMTLQYCYYNLGDFDQALALKKEVLRIMEQRFHLRSYVMSFSVTAWAYGLLGRWEEAEAEAHEALRAAEEYSDNSLISFASTSFCALCSWKGDLGPASEYGELALQKAISPLEKGMSQGALAATWIRAGEPHRGIGALTPLVSILRAGGFKLLLIMCEFSLGKGYRQVGEYDKATQTVEECLELAKSCGIKPYYIGSAHLILGEIALETNPKQAAPHFEKSMAVFREIKAENLLAQAYAGYGRLHKQQGNVVKAREDLTKALEIFQRLGTLMEPDKVRETLAQLPGV